MNRVQQLEILLCMTLLVTLSIVCQGADQKAIAPPEELGLKIVNPSASLRVAPNQTISCEVKVTRPEDSRPPDLVQIELKKGKVIYGGFEAKKAIDNSYVATVRTPKEPGKYQMRSISYYHALITGTDKVRTVIIDSVEVELEVVKR